MTIKKKMVEKTCVTCKQLFKCANRPLNRKTCSYECRLKNNKRVAKERSSKKKTKTCKVCHSQFIGLAYYSGTGKCNDCINAGYSEQRKGEGNPAWNGGNSHHTIAKRYHEHLQNVGYDVEEQGCELCHKTNQPLYDIHHIVYKSERPKHKEMHNIRNLIFVCRSCHMNLHASKLSRASLVAERNLTELFGNL